MEKIKKSGHVRKNINRIVSLICSATMLMSTVQLSMPAAVYAEAATEAPVSQETQAETRPAAQAETQPAPQAETQPAAKAETQPAQQETQHAVQSEAAQSAAQASAQPESQAAPQKEEQAAAPENGETVPKSEAQPSSSEKGTEERETSYEASEEAKKFVSDVSSLNWDSIKALRKTQFEADDALVHHPEDAALKNAASNADQAMKQARDRLAALRKAYSTLPEEDRADQSVKEADQKLETVITNGSSGVPVGKIRGRNAR